MSIEGTAQTEYASLSGKIHTIVIDKSLSISGACADAKATGEAVEKVESEIDKANKSVEEAKKLYEEAIAGIHETATEVAKEAVDALTADDLNAYEKEEVLSNETKTLYGLGEDAVPNDIFNDLAVPVGTIQFTSRTDLDDRWALCNGALFDPEEYPELALMKPDMRSLVNQYWNTDCFTASGDSSTGVGSCDFQHVIEADGYQVGLSIIMVGASTYGSYGFRITYSQDWFETSTSYTINNVSGYSDVPAFENYNIKTGFLKYVDGLFVLAHKWARVDASYSPAVVCITDDITSAEWSNVSTGLNNFTLSEIYDIWSENNTYYMAGSDGSNNALIFQTASLTDANWSIVTAATSITPKSFYRANGYYAFLCGTSSAYKILYTQNPIGTWTTVNVTLSATMSSNDNMLRYYEKEGVWGIFGYKTSNYPALAYTEDITSSEWTVIYGAEGSSVDVSSTGYLPYDIGWAGDRYVGISSSYSASNSRYFEFYDLLDPSTWAGYSLSDLGLTYSTYAGRRNLNTLPRLSEDGSKFVITMNDELLFLPIYALPIVSSDSAYAYIKVKEG